MVTILVMLAYTGVNPIFPTDGTTMLLPSQVASSGRLTDVYGLVRARTLITIDTFLFFWVRPCLVGTTEDVLFCSLGPDWKTVYTSFFKHSFKRVGDLGNVRDAHKFFPLLILLLLFLPHVLITAEG